MGYYRATAPPPLFHDLYLRHAMLGEVFREPLNNLMDLLGEFPTGDDDESVGTLVPGEG